MNRSLITLGLVAAAAAFTACSDSTSPVQVVSDQQLTADVAAQSGDAIAVDIGELVAGEVNLVPAPPADDVLSPQSLVVNRSRVCYDAQDQVQGACNATTTAKIVMTLQIDGSTIRTNTTNQGTDSLNVAVHRARTVTISGLAGTETSRIHDGVGTAADTASFNRQTDGSARSRTMTIAALDSVEALTFNLPHASNPWPVSGKIVRNVSGKIVVTSGTNQGERTFTRRVEVDFPADAQGNVVIQINGKTCNLNLVTRVVSSCST